MGKLNAAAVAEDLDVYVLRPPAWTREDRGDVVLIDGPEPSALSRDGGRIRLGNDPADGIADVRGWFRDRGRAAFTWKVGTHPAVVARIGPWFMLAGSTRC